MKTYTKDRIEINNLYKLLVDQSPFQITFFSTDLELLYVNEYTRNFLGKELDEIKGASVLDFMTPETVAPFSSLIESITAENPVVTIENSNVDYEGNTHWILWHDRGIFNDSGDLIGYQSIGQDVTGKKEIEDALGENRRRLKDAQRIGNMGGWEWSADGNQTYWSDETYRLLGLFPGEITPDQDYYRSRVLPEDLENFTTWRQQDIKNRSEEFSTEYRLLDANGELRWIRDQGLLSYGKDGLERISGTILDITESKELQLSLEEYINLEATLLEISNLFMLSEEENAGKVIQRVLKILGLRTSADRSYLVLPENNDEQIYIWCHEDEFSSQQDDSSCCRKGISGIMTDRDDIIIPDTAEWKSDSDSGWFNRHDVNALISVKLYQNNKICGYLCLDSKKPKPGWRKTDLGFLRIAGEMCTNALESIRIGAEIEREKELLSVTLMSIEDGFILLSSGGSIEMINSSAIDMLGADGIEPHNKKFAETFELTDTELNRRMNIKHLLNQAGRKKKHSECSFKHPNGSTRILSYSCSRVAGPGESRKRLALIFRDITEERRKQDEIAYMSFHDSLTGLYNRAFMDVELKRLNRARQLPLSIITGDVNGLKLVNDVFGHEEGDRLLIEIGRILEGCCREEDVIARWGGDEFSILLPSTDQNGADKICERIRQRCEEQCDLSISPSIALGSAVKLSPDEDISNIMREAEDRMYRRKLLDDRSVRSDIITSLQNSMFEKSFETEEHTHRMLKIAVRFGKELKLPMNLQSDLELLALMHDMGKIAVPARILGKTEKLTDEDWEEIKRHPEAGYRIAKSSQKLAGIADLILAHHERWDGKGYPRGQSGEEIPELARIISIIDTYDVMTSGRIYKKGVSPETACREIENCAGTQFDPYFAEKFVIMMSS